MTQTPAKQAHRPLTVVATEIVERGRSCQHDSAAPGHATSAPASTRPVAPMRVMHTADAPDLEHLSSVPEATVVIVDGASWVAVKSTATVITDPAAKAELRKRLAQAWFDQPDESTATDSASGHLISLAQAMVLQSTQTEGPLGDHQS